MSFQALLSLVLEGKKKPFRDVMAIQRYVDDGCSQFPVSPGLLFAMNPQ